MILYSDQAEGKVAVVSAAASHLQRSRFDPALVELPCSSYNHIDFHWVLWVISKVCWEVNVVQKGGKSYSSHPYARQ